METQIIHRQHSADKQRAAFIAQNVPGCLPLRLCLMNHAAGDDEKSVQYIQRGMEDHGLLLKMAAEFTRN